MSTVVTMIGYLRGQSRGSSIIDVNGVGYLVHCPVPPADGEDVELHVVTVVRDDAITLYGFPSILERDVFTALTKVSGVGPASALALLADLGVAGVARAVSGKDEVALGKVRGIGKKTATSIATLCVLPAAALTATDPQAHDISSTLVALGFDRPQAQSAAARAVEQHPGAGEDVLIPAALAILSEAAA